MLPDKDAMATIAVRDLDAAKKFYGEVLGLKLINDMGKQAALYQSGSSTIVVYPSEFAGTNKATSATWGVGEDLDAIVEHLKKHAVQFEHYDMPGSTLEGDIHVMGDFKAAWFKDPDGNILHINNH